MAGSIKQSGCHFPHLTAGSVLRRRIALSNREGLCSVGRVAVVWAATKAPRGTVTQDRCMLLLAAPQCYVGLILECAIARQQAHQSVSWGLDREHLRCWHLLRWAYAVRGRSPAHHFRTRAGHRFPTARVAPRPPPRSHSFSASSKF
jgi:hypothetical protein